MLAPTENSTAQPTWVNRLKHVTIEYNDGTNFDGEMTAIEVKALTDKMWVEERLSQTAILSITISHEISSHS